MPEDSGLGLEAHVMDVSMTTPAPKRVVIIGGVAGGMSAATRLRRLDADATITVLERSGHVSFANCGLPYFVGGLIEEEEDLTLQTPRQLFDRFRLDVRVNDEVVAIDRTGHTVRTRSMVDGRENVVPYDKLILSMGAAPVRPPIPGYDRVRTLRTVEDAASIAAQVDVVPATAVVIGAGFIGLEMAENLVAQGLDTTVVEAAPQVLTPLDSELAVLVGDELAAHGVRVELSVSVASVEERSITLSDGRTMSADLVIGAIGVRPDVRLAEMAGLRLGPEGGLAVNDANQTSDPDVYAVGDAVEKPDAVSHATSLIALANVANRQGRRVADHIAGRPSHRVASLGTSIVKVFDIVAATVGWNERRLEAAGRPFRAIHSHPFDHATYYPGASRMSAKLIFDPDNGTILGAQIVGRSGVDKRIDVIATAMVGGLTAPSWPISSWPTPRPFRRPRTRSIFSGTWRRTSSAVTATSSGRPSWNRWSRRAGHWSMYGPPRSTRPVPYKGRSTCPSTLSVSTSIHSDMDGSSSIARSVSGGTRRQHCSRSWESRPATSMAATRPGRRGSGPRAPGPEKGPTTPQCHDRQGVATEDARMPRGSAGAHSKVGKLRFAPSFFALAS